MKGVLGWIGTGVMGAHMCRHLLKSGYQVNLYTRTRAKAQPILQQYPNSKWMPPKEIAVNSDVTFLMLGYPHDVQSMVLGSQGILPTMKKNSILIDHTTSNPSLAQRIAKQALKYNIKSIDAPVTGGDVGARTGKLVTMCGGAAQTIQQIRPILEIYSKCIQNFGGPGRGQHAKLTNQIILAGNMIGMTQGLIYASRMGMDLKTVIDTICQGAASSTSLSVLGTRIANKDFNPGFYVQHYIKDMQIALEESKRVGLELPNLSLVKNLYEELQKEGGGKLGTQALIKVLEKRNKYQIP